MQSVEVLKSDLIKNTFLQFHPLDVYYRLRDTYASKDFLEKGVTCLFQFKTNKKGNFEDCASICGNLTLIALPENAHFGGSIL